MLYTRCEPCMIHAFQQDGDRIAILLVEFLSAKLHQAGLQLNIGIVQVQ